MITELSTTCFTCEKTKSEVSKNCCVFFFLFLAPSNDRSMAEILAAARCEVLLWHNLRPKESVDVSVTSRLWWNRRCVLLFLQWDQLHRRGLTETRNCFDCLNYNSGRITDVMYLSMQYVNVMLALWIYVLDHCRLEMMTEFRLAVTFV